MIPASRPLLWDGVATGPVVDRPSARASADVARAARAVPAAMLPRCAPARDRRPCGYATRIAWICLVRLTGSVSLRRSSRRQKSLPTRVVRLPRWCASRPLGLPPNSCVFLDDYDANVRAAEAVGMHGIVYGADRVRLWWNSSRISGPSARIVMPPSDSERHSPCTCPQLVPELGGPPRPPDRTQSLRAKPACLADGRHLVSNCAETRRKSPLLASVDSPSNG
jgi:hypothetical protein